MTDSNKQLAAPWAVKPEKRAAFEYFLLCLLNEEFKLRGEKDSTDFTEFLQGKMKEEAEEILSSYDWVRLNKLLFFTVIEDELQIYRSQSDNGTDNQENREILVECFDRLTAYPNGPVEAELYERRDSGMFAMFELDGGNRLSFKKKDYKGNPIDPDQRYELMKSNSKQYQEALLKTVSEVFGWTKIYYKEELSEKSHKLSVWEDCQFKGYDGNFDYGNVSAKIKHLREDPKKREEVFRTYEGFKKDSIAS